MPEQADEDSLHEQQGDEEDDHVGASWRVTDTSLIEARHELEVERASCAYWRDAYRWLSESLTLDTQNAKSQSHP